MLNVYISNVEFLKNNKKFTYEISLYCINSKQVQMESKKDSWVKRKCILKFKLWPTSLTNPAATHVASLFNASSSLLPRSLPSAGNYVLHELYKANLSGSVIEVSWILNLLTYTNGMRRKKRGVS